MSKPTDTILIVLEGGLVASVCTADGTPTPNVVVVDYDVEGAEPADITTTVHNDEAFVHIPWTAKDTKLVEWVDEYMGESK